jgi:hypothetical protein
MNAWDATSYEGKETILRVVRDEAARLTELAGRPGACTCHSGPGSDSASYSPAGWPRGSRCLATRAVGVRGSSSMSCQ